MQRRILTLVGLVVVLLSPVVPPADAGSSPAVTLTLSPSAITFGGSQAASSSILADAPCVAGRIVDLEQKPAGSTTWTTVDQQNSDSQGDVTFASQQPQSNAAYRAVAEASLVGAVACDQLTSKVVHGVVRAAVTLAFGHTPVTAGSCTKASVTVQPVKAGQQVVLQERGPSGWNALRTLPLDGSSAATTRLCETWDDLGRHRIRARWASQDAANAAGSSPVRTLSVVEAAWMQHLDSLAHGRAAGVSIRADGRVLYEREASDPFAPASNEKLLLSMALLDRLGTSRRIATVAAAPSVSHGVVHGDLWILGHGDPSTGPGQLGALARAVTAAGVRRITGRVMGSSGYFSHDWFAPGWKRTFPRDEVGLPSALTFRENHLQGRNVGDPERFAAAALLQRLEARGVKVWGGTPGSGRAPGGLTAVATVRSVPVIGLLRHMDHLSDNFYAEVLGKGLAAELDGPPGTIARAAGAIQRWAGAHGATVAVHDSSGLSYDDRVTPHGVTTLLQFASGTPWGAELRGVLPAAGQGTLHGRHLAGVRIHAKTGTLDNISALSGWVWLTQLHTWGEFSILDRGMSYTTSKDLEDSIVRTATNAAR